MMPLRRWILHFILLCVCVKVTQLCLTLCNPMKYITHGILPARILEWVAFPFSRGSSQPRSPALQADSLPAEPPEKPKNAGVDSLFLLQSIFPTQESKRGHLHCRWILYQQRYLPHWKSWSSLLIIVRYNIGQRICSADSYVNFYVFLLFLSHLLSHFQMYLVPLFQNLSGSLNSTYIVFVPLFFMPIYFLASEIYLYVFFYTCCLCFHFSYS